MVESVRNKKGGGKMTAQELISQLATSNDTKLVMVVLDGVGDIAVDGKTPLQAANTPNLDALARFSELGQAVPIVLGVTPGSGPGHLGLFGYSPMKYEIGRGILEALGGDVEVGNMDMVARGNFATIDNGVISDRRAGRPTTEESTRVVEKLCEEIIRIEDIKVSLYPGREHRFVLKLTGEGLDERITDTDPQKEGEAPLECRALVPEAEKTARIINELLAQLKKSLSDEEEMSFALLRGFSKYPDIPQFGDLFKMKAAAIAVYPMYRGLAKLVGMNVVSTGQTIDDEIDTLTSTWKDYDFFFLHVKKTDSYGEDGNFDAKVKVIEEFDRVLPKIKRLKPDVLLITADHSTPVPMKAHSWHPVPLMLHSKFVRAAGQVAFNEFECSRGVLGTIHSTDQIPLMMGNALRLEKFGA